MDINMVIKVYFKNIFQCENFVINKNMYKF